jgi:hypothetical protein
LGSATGGSLGVDVRAIALQNELVGRLRGFCTEAHDVAAANSAGYSVGGREGGVRIHAALLGVRIAADKFIRRTLVKARHVAALLVVAAPAALHLRLELFANARVGLEIKTTTQIGVETYRLAGATFGMILLVTLGKDAGIVRYRHTFRIDFAVTASAADASAAAVVAEERIVKWGGNHISVRVDDSIPAFAARHFALVSVAEEAFITFMSVGHFLVVSVDLQYGNDPGPFGREFDLRATLS